VTTRTRNLVLAAIVAIGAVLRWHSIGAGSIWIDEAGSLTLARMPFGEFLRTLWQYEANMSLYYALLRVWLLLGTSEAWVRSLSALFGVLSIPAIYVLGRRLFSETTGLLAAAFLAANMFHVWFSQDSRSYTLAVFLVILSLLFLDRALEDPEDRGAWVAYVAASVLAAYAHFFAVLTIGAAWLAVGPRRARSLGLHRVALVLVSIVILLLPLAAFIALRDQGQLNWVPPTTWGVVAWTIVIISGLNPLGLLLVFVGVGLALWTSGRDDRDSRGVRLVALAWAFPLVVIGLLSPFKHLYFFRYFAICIPPATLLMARVLTPRRSLPTWGRWALGVVATGVLAIALGATGVYYARFVNWGGDWRSAVEYVLAHRQPGDAAVFQVSAGLDSYRYYVERVASRGGSAPLPEVLFPGPGELASAHLVPNGEVLAAASQGHKRLWLVLHQKEAGDLPVRLLAPYTLVEEKDFTGNVPELKLKVALYERR
jgi:4-amino-4-deoxy-L-arabinose transferase-like glycosyltransferase